MASASRAARNSPAPVQKKAAATKKRLPSIRRPLSKAPIYRTGGAAGLYGGNGEGLLYRLLPRPGVDPCPSRRWLYQRLFRVRRWPAQTSPEVAPGTSSVVTHFQGKLRRQ